MVVWLTGVPTEPTQLAYVQVIKSQLYPDCFEDTYLKMKKNITTASP